MTALNLMFFNLSGLVVWGNSLTMEVRGAWETRRSVAFGGSIRPVDAEMARDWLGRRIHTQENAAPCVKTDTKKQEKTKQLSLF